MIQSTLWLTGKRAAALLCSLPQTGSEGHNPAQLDAGLLKHRNDNAMDEMLCSQRFFPN